MSSGVSQTEETKEGNTSVEPPSKRTKTEQQDISAEGKTENMGVKSSNGMSDNGDAILDKNLYSRQIYALGESAMMRLRKSTVLISGLGSVGVEIAKNLILGGVRHVTIHDKYVTKWNDLSAQYYLRESDIGRNRAEACFERLAELNDSVTCKLSKDELTEDFVKGFELVVLTDTPLATQMVVNAWTRKHGRCLLVAVARGLFSYVFVDVGDKFVVDDPNGEICKEVSIENVDSETGDVTTLENIMHGLEDGDFVTFTEIKGMVELNNTKPIQVTVKKPHVFNIGKAASGLSPYSEGGRVKQVKMPITVQHKSITDSRNEPEILTWDYAKYDHPAQLHSLWLALYAFESKHNRIPKPRDDDDAALLRSELPPDSKVDEKLLKMFSYQASGNLVSMASLVGGIAAQEAMKAVTHHMTPLKQFLYIDCIEALPGDWSPFFNEKLTIDDCKPADSRYDGQVAVFGHAFQNALMRQKYFIVGAGAIGCELLKNLSMMGIACDKDGVGKLKISDMDQIEISNLNRQFLFRREDVGSKKSEVAAKAVKSFNSSMRIEALSERLGPETERIFDDEFFSDLNGVLNALDNVDARRYMDRRCVYYRLPLLESGTMGTKGNTQVIYPYLTESYGSSADPPERDIPICTLKNFPNEIHHTIQWARELFVGIFTNPTEAVNQFLTDERTFLDRIDQLGIGQKAQILEQILRSLVDEKPETIDDCIKWARLSFEENFNYTIAQLLHTFPADQTTEQGVKFWSGTKRCPHPLKFDPNEKEHFNYVWSASILRALQYKLPPITDKQKFLASLSAFTPPPFKPKSNIKIAVTEAEIKEEADADDIERKLQSLRVKIAKMDTKGMKLLTAIDFEKDDDTNHHMEFITAASNLRAENYDIPPADRMKTKQIAGRIIPAIATTNAAVAGLVMMELYKIVSDGSGLMSVPIDRFKNGFLNLALPFFGFSEPIAAPKKKFSSGFFTLWDRLEIQGPKKLKELIQIVQEESGLDVTMLSCGVSLLFSFFMTAKKKKDRLEQDMQEIVEEVTRRKIPDYLKSVVFEVMANDKDNEDVEIPYIKYNLK